MNTPLTIVFVVVAAVIAMAVTEPAKPFTTQDQINALTFQGPRATLGYQNVQAYWHHLAPVDK